MDNTQDQAGTPNAANADRSSQNPSTSAASRKSSPSAQSPSATPDAQDQTTANAGADRQSEGEQTNGLADTLLNTAMNSDKQWIEDSGVLNSVNQLPQGLKDLGNRALDKVNSLSTTQKVVGGAILAAGIGWLATRKGKSSSDDSSSPYNYGRQRDAGYGRRSYGYQASDASTSRRPVAGTGRADSGSPYANGGSRFGNNTGVQAGSRTDHGQQTSSTDFGSSTDE